ncbi:alpha/beta hydrolase [Intrasporangium mesophilum]
MLSDAPHPDDLPEAQPGYAALPPDYTPPSQGSTAYAGPELPPPGPPSGPMGSSAHQPGAAAPGRHSPLRRVLALVAVVALLGAVGLAVWRVGNPPTAAQPRQPASGWATPGAGGSPSASPTQAPPTDYAAALRDYYTQKVDWKPCSGDSKQQCATIQVPVDYSKPQGDRFHLALRKVPATDPSKRVGSLLVNPGGPGASGVEFAQAASSTFSPDVLAAYDIVGFDPRGIAASDAVDCLSDSDMDLLFSTDPTPDSAAEKAKGHSALDGVTERCATRGGEKARHMSTTEVARDMDIMRVLLGDQKLNFFGGSYGTFLGALYADLFPKQVGRMVLDSAMSPNQTDEQEMTYDIQGFESSIDAFLDWCVVRDDCALGRDKASAKQKLVDLLDKAERDGLTTSRPGLSRIGEGWVAFGIFMCLYSDQLWEPLNQALTQALDEGKGDLLLRIGSLFVDRSPSGKYAKGSYLQAMIPVRCADWPRTPPTAARVAEEDQAKAAHPLWARMTGDLYDNCRTWPSAGRPPKGTTLGVGAAPILVIGNERDPATPIGGTKQLAKDLASGVLLTSDHDGHGTYNQGNTCVDDAVDGYLVDGRTPPDGKAC